MARNLILAIAVSLGLGQLGTAWALSVDEAYRAIPHKQTTFQTEQSRLSATDSKQLKQIFEITDEAIVVRVQAMQALQKRDLTLQLGTYDNLEARLKDMSLNGELSQVVRLLLESIKLQRQYLTSWKTNLTENTNATFKFGQGAPYFNLALEAHSKLIEAYQRLMKTYPAESPHNTQAFFDHLCALDFI